MKEARQEKEYILGVNRLHETMENANQSTRAESSSVVSEDRMGGWGEQERAIIDHCFDCGDRFLRVWWWFVHAQSCPTLTPWTIAHQAPLPMGFFNQEYWSGLPFLSPRDLPNPGIEVESPVSPALQGDSLPTEPKLISYAPSSTLSSSLTHNQRDTSFQKCNLRGRHPVMLVWVR